MSQRLQGRDLGAAGLLGRGTPAAALDAAQAAGRGWAGLQEELPRGGPQSSCGSLSDHPPGHLHGTSLPRASDLGDLEDASIVLRPVTHCHLGCTCSSEETP